ncbi:hypothetical protein BC943DRAFT_317802 [Umbelopsis sp. AD052]|nr:hypothetical protein BC943DRAFT_317802 [Umbelopsis sp. AD052]
MEDDSEDPQLGAACYRCRGFRHACDRKKPACSRCKRRGIDCTYPEAAPTLKKLQKATETLGERLKKFGDRLKTTDPKTTDPLTKESKGISLQRLASPNSLPSGPSPPPTSASSFSVYPCTKCFKDLQQCDLTQPTCQRCQENGFECTYTKTVPKANHVSQVLTTMNKVVDQWQESLDKMAKDFAQKTRDLGANMKMKQPRRPFAWKITSTGRGLSMESSVNSFNDLSKLVDQFKRTMHITPKDPLEEEAKHQTEMFDDTSSIHTASDLGFAIWNSWAHSNISLPHDYALDISQQLIDSLVHLYARTPCCSQLRLSIIDANDLLERYSLPEKQVSDMLTFAVCAMTARNAFQLHVWNVRAKDEPQQNMGKVLSTAFCVKSRELLAECFDEPKLETIQASFIISYCNHLNGYSSSNTIYDWVAFAMAQDLGLYDSDRQLTHEESMLVWSFYYHNTWYRVLQGGSSDTLQASQFYPQIPLPSVDLGSNADPIAQHVNMAWHHLFKLQVLRHDLMSRLVSAQKLNGGEHGPQVDLFAMQDKLFEFYKEVPASWQNPQPMMFARDPSVIADRYHNVEEHYENDLNELSSYCILNLHVHYNINKILLYQAFFPADQFPTTAFALQCLCTCIEAAYAITETLDVMVNHRNDCNVPILGFLFANTVYLRLLKYPDERFRQFARHNLRRSIQVSKTCNSFLFDFELAQKLVFVMEQTICAVDPSITIEDDCSIHDMSTASLFESTNMMDIEQVAKSEPILFDFESASSPAASIKIEVQPSLLQSPNDSVRQSFDSFNTPLVSRSSTSVSPSLSSINTMQFSNLNLTRQISPAGVELPNRSPASSFQPDEHIDSQLLPDLPNKYIGEDDLVADMWQAVDEVRCVPLF